MRSVNLGRWSRWIERYFNIKGGGGLMDVEPSLRVMLTLASGVEDRYLQGWGLYANQTTVAAVAAQFGTVRLRNPANSGVVAVIQRLIWFAAGDSPVLGWGATTVDLTNIVSGTNTRIDPRSNPQPTLIFSNVAQAAQLTAPLFQVPAGNTGGTQAEFITSIDQQWPILPGQSLNVQSVVANVGINCSVEWRERALEASELT